MGRMLQRLGLVILPVAMVLQLWPTRTGRPVLSVGQMLVAMVFGMCLFWIGYLMEAYRSRS